MEYEWDEAKRRSNLRKHGFDFRDAERMRWSFAAQVDTQDVDGEVREKWVGPLANGLVAVILVERRTRRRIISMRDPSVRELEQWRTEMAQRW